MRVLLAEDDPALGRVVAQGLREQTYAVDVALDGVQALHLSTLNEYDAIVLDVLMPKRSGLDVCRAIRARGASTPILLLTARDAVDDRIVGLDAGADDYLTKPFAFGELLARLRALVRRVPALLPQVLAVGDLRIDTGSQRVERAGRAIRLTSKEYALLEHLARNAGKVVGRADICAHVWDDNHDPLSNAIEVYVNRLRGKIDGADCVPLIHTRRGAGYMLAEESSPNASEPSPADKGATPHSRPRR